MFEAKSFQFGTTGSSFGGALGFDFTSANATDSSQSLIGKMGTIGGSTGCGGLFGGDKKLISGTKIKFEPPGGPDTRHQCITAMKHYEDKSIEELRYEDWIEVNESDIENPKSGGFGTSTDFSSTGGFFGSPNNKPEVPCGTNPTFGIRTASTSNDTKHSFGTNPTFGTNSTFGISRAPTFKPKVSFGTIPSGNKPSFGAFGFSTTDDKSRTSSPWGITANSGTFSFGKTSTSGFGAAPTTNGNNSSPPLFGNMETNGGNTAHGLFGPSLVSAFSNSVNEAKTPSITGFRFKTTKLTETDNSDTRKNVFSNGVVTRTKSRPTKELKTMEEISTQRKEAPFSFDWNYLTLYCGDLKHFMLKKEFYCNDCSTAICKKCLTGSHKRHDFDELENAREATRRELESLKQPYEEELFKQRKFLASLGNQRMKMKHEAKIACQKVDERTNTICQAVKTIGEKIKQKSSVSLHKNEELLSKSIMSINLKVSQLDPDSISKVSDKKSDLECIEYLPRCKKILEDNKATPEELVVPTLQTTEFQAGDIDRNLLVKMFGKIGEDATLEDSDDDDDDDDGEK